MLWYVHSTKLSVEAHSDCGEEHLVEEIRPIPLERSQSERENQLPGINICVWNLDK